MVHTHPEYSGSPLVLESGETKISSLGYHPKELIWCWIYITLSVPLPKEEKPWIGLFLPFAPSCAVLGEGLSKLRWNGFTYSFQCGSVLALCLLGTLQLSKWLLELTYILFGLFIVVKLVSLWGNEVWGFLFHHLAYVTLWLTLKYLVFFQYLIFFIPSHMVYLTTFLNTHVICCSLLVDSIFFNTY